MSFAVIGTLRCLVDGGKRYTLKQEHSYLVTPPDFFFGKNGNPPSDIIRKPHGRIAFAHAELMGYQMWEGAVHEGERAAAQMLAV